MLSLDVQLYELMVLSLKWAFLNPEIRKVFFDGKKDIEALHYLFKIGIRNVFDIQATHMALA